VLDTWITGVFSHNCTRQLSGCHVIWKATMWGLLLLGLCRLMRSKILWQPWTGQPGSSTTPNSLPSLPRCIKRCAGDTGTHPSTGSASEEGNKKEIDNLTQWHAFSSSASQRPCLLQASVSNPQTARPPSVGCAVLILPAVPMFAFCQRCNLPRSALPCPCIRSERRPGELSMIRRVTLTWG
jgi:hypothetical protein